MVAMPFRVARQIVKRIANPPRCLEIDSINNGEPQLVYINRATEATGGLIRHPYIIQQRAYGRGLLSLASSVVCHIHVARRYALTPVVDLSCQPNEYKDPEFESADEKARTNPWDYYFQPVSNLHLQEAVASSLSLLSTLGFPAGYPQKMLVSQVQALRDIAETCLKPVDEIASVVETTWAELASDGPVLGVHFRGQEQKTMPYHPLSPTNEQIFAAIELAIAEQGFRRIFLATEDLDYLELIQNRYGKVVFSMPHLRTRSPVNAYRISPRPMHRYLLGREILTDTLILSRCQGLVSSTSNVTEIARAINNGRFCLDLVIDNGLNVRNWRVARYLWDLKRILPVRLGGFSLEAITPYPEIDSGIQPSL
jgi:hypothetical protein